MNRMYFKATKWNGIVYSMYTDFEKITFDDIDIDDEYMVTCKSTYIPPIPVFVINSINLLGNYGDGTTEFIYTKITEEEYLLCQVK